LGGRDLLLDIGIEGMIILKLMLNRIRESVPELTGWGCDEVECVFERSKGT
jgi:hypothetical protein